MKTKLNQVSPFLILLLPALLVMSMITANPEPEKFETGGITKRYRTGSFFTVPAFKGLIKNLF